MSYDITMVNQSGFVVDMYYNNIDSKAIAAFNNVEIDFRNRMWALVPREDTDSGETLLDLVYAYNQYPVAKLLLKGILLILTHASMLLRVDCGFFFLLQAVRLFQWLLGCGSSRRPGRSAFIHRCVAVAL